MKKPDLTATEWQQVEELLADYADGYSSAATVLDNAMQDMIDNDITEGLLFEMPGEVYEALAYRLDEMGKEAGHE